MARTCAELRPVAFTSSVVNLASNRRNGTEDQVGAGRATVRRRTDLAVSSLPSRGTEQRLGHDERGDREDEVGEGGAESVGGQPGGEPAGGE
jgi:hypothetical protein